MTERVIRVTLDPSGVGTGASVVEGNLNRVDRARQRTQTGFESLRGIIMGVVGSVVVREILKFADAWQTVANRLALVATGQENLNSLQREAFGIAQRTRSDLVATADLYGRLARAAGQYGLSQREVAGITETVNQLFQVSGAAVTEQIAGIRQLGQALGRGVLRGDELITVLENAPRLAQAIADTMGVAVGSVAELGREGKITGDILIESLQRQAPKIAEEFSRLTPTIASAFTIVKNEFTRFFGEAFGGTHSLHDSIVATGRAVIGMAESIGIAWRSITENLGGEGSFLQVFKQQADEILPGIGRSILELPITIRFAIERATIELVSFFEQLQTRAALMSNSIHRSLLGPSPLGKALGLELPGLGAEDFVRREAELRQELALEQGGRQSSIDDINRRRAAAIAELDRSITERAGGGGRAPAGAGGGGGGLDLSVSQAQGFFAGEGFENWFEKEAKGATDAIDDISRAQVDYVRERDLALNQSYMAERALEDEIHALRKQHAEQSLGWIDTTTDALKNSVDDMIRTNEFSVRGFVQFLIAELSRKQIFSAIDAIGDALRRNLGQSGGGGGFWSLVGGFLGRAFGFGGGQTLEEFTPNLPARLPAPYPGPSFAHGGEFMVGGSGGIDKTHVGFMATRGEHVAITPAGQGRQINVRSGDIYVKTESKEGADLERRLARVLHENNERLKDEVVYEIDRGIR